MATEMKREAPASLLLDVPQVAAALGVSRTFVYQLLERGELEYCKLGARTKVPMGAVLSYVEGRLEARRMERVEIETPLFPRHRARR